MASSRRALSSCSFLKATSALSSVQALLDSTPGVSRKSSELRSFFSATMRFSRKYCATIGACSAIEAWRQKGQLVWIGDGEIFRDAAEPVPFRAGGQSPIARIGGEFF